MGEYADYALDRYTSRRHGFSIYGYNDRYLSQRKGYKKLANKSNTYFVEGTVYWAKIVGDSALHDNYDGDARQWAYELVPDDIQFLKDERLLDRLKEPKDDKNPDKGDYLVLKKPEFTKDGVKNKPITIIDNTEGESTSWDDRRIGNGTRVVAKLNVVDYGKGKKKAIYTQALRVEDLVPFEGGDAFGDYDGSKGANKAPAKAAKPKTKKVAEELEEMDDDVPF